MAHDPVVVEQTRRVLALDFGDSPDLLINITYVSKPVDAVREADALLIVTK